MKRGLYRNLPDIEPDSETQHVSEILGILVQHCLM